ncbi:hypothetical protein CUMW_163330 [Citrus unshiu]|uniref:Uncharacterized protein n=1 Tax=Citrus unshiu TaxID=55188 RepID=A0A2H5PSG6_CITUN|nr:hypothetical protein CUMW_163330 [Citrus unshiu]GAY55290.1 hypothetical protein CUMW_163330 [Citrus unshiu]GAY55291.1 hypothetical protein CUMW_163330 [Citrus unshiu]
MSTGSLCSSTTQINGFTGGFMLQKTNLNQPSSLSFTRRRIHTIVKASARVDKSRKVILLFLHLFSLLIAKLGEQVKAVKTIGWIVIGSCDIVMDGRVVQTLRIGPLVVDALRPVSRPSLDVHLRPLWSNSSPFILHRNFLTQIQRFGRLSGVVLNLLPSLSAIECVLMWFDRVLSCRVNLAFGGQSLLRAK